MTQTSLELLNEWYDRIWVRQDLEAINLLFTPDTEAMGMMDFAVGPEDFRVLAEAILAQIDVTGVQFERAIEMGDWAWATFTAQAVALRDRSPIAVSGQIMARVTDGRIVEAYNQVDFLSLFEQLGYLPKDSLALCLSGEGLGL
ncbi:nuclear transport factor 2 family protein [uncultured Aliiroseovarius sp.]|uniref:nuclear transport factor 2 family protein n=1 Tax=uncultured Aliiroseovarius sp. TaxID=1658783 RepID=UPI002629BBD9|nr:nuclear transport factor 2 family protein [uncultured Aliiroseovarius sp.]